MSDKSCAITSNGETILLALPDRDGMDRQIALSFDQAGALAITLPRLLTAALRQKHSDPRLRHVYVVRDCTVELASDQHHVLLGLSAQSGFDVVFAIDLSQATTLVRALGRGRDALKQAKNPPPN